MNMQMVVWIAGDEGRSLCLLMPSVTLGIGGFRKFSEFGELRSRWILCTFD